MNAVPEVSLTRVDASPTILCVDDEPNILAALRRLFRPCRYRMLMASSGEEGLRLLETESVDGVISDMHMSGMDGAAFLEHVCKRWPDIFRLLLTGHSDMSATIDAINRSEIHHYISKPWKDEDLLHVIAAALQQKAIKLENKRLHTLTDHQGAVLQALDATLEEKVKERTAQLAAAKGQPRRERLRVEPVT